MENNNSEIHHPPPGFVSEMGYPLVNEQFAIENGPVKIKDFPINSMVDLSIAM